MGGVTQDRSYCNEATQTKEESAKKILTGINIFFPLKCSYFSNAQRLFFNNFFSEVLTTFNWNRENLTSPFGCRTYRVHCLMHHNKNCNIHLVNKNLCDLSSFFVLISFLVLSKRAITSVLTNSFDQWWIQDFELLVQNAFLAPLPKEGDL